MSYYREISQLAGYYSTREISQLDVYNIIVESTSINRLNGNPAKIIQLQSSACNEAIAENINVSNEVEKTRSDYIVEEHDSNNYEYNAVRNVLFDETFETSEIDCDDSYRENESTKNVIKHVLFNDTINLEHFHFQNFHLLK